MRLSRHISILLALLILASNMGLAFNVHFCEDSISSVSLAYERAEPKNEHHKKEAHNHEQDNDRKSCCAASTTDHDSCCDNDVVKIEDTGEGKVIVKTLQLELGTLCGFVDLNPVPNYAFEILPVKNQPSFYCESNAPPLFKLYCQYILYA